MQEKCIEIHLRKRVKKLGGLCLKVVSPNYAGVPDRLVILPDGSMFFVELKAPGKKPRQIQKSVMRDLYRHRVRVATIDNLQTANNFLERISKCNSNRTNTKRR